MSSKLEEIRDHLDGILLDLEEVPTEIPEMSYPELKMQLMVNYVANLAYYITLRMQGTSVADHPVFKHLACLRTFMERLVPLDASLKYQIDKLLLQNEEEEETASAPNLAAFVPSALKSISVDQVTKGMQGNFEIDPAMIAAQIMKVSSQKKSQDVPKAKKQKVESVDSIASDDEEIDSDLEE